MENNQEENLTLYGWLFTFNPYIGKWAGYHRDVNYFNGDGPVHYDEDINKLIETIKQWKKQQHQTK